MIRPSRRTLATSPSWFRTTPNASGSCCGSRKFRWYARGRQRMNLKHTGWLVAGVLACTGVVFAFQKPFRQYPGVEYYRFETPPDASVAGEWTFARMMFPGGWNDGYRGRFDGDWRLGNTLWTQDYPRADRHFSEAVRRLTRIHTRSVEQPVNLDENEEFDLPWVYAVQVGEWGLTPKEGRELREYLLRGGFFMADDFHGNEERQVFEDSMKLVFPDRPIVDISEDDPIFPVSYTHLRAHETGRNLVCRLLLEK